MTQLSMKNIPWKLQKIPRTNEFSKVAGYKINTYTFTLFLYSRNEHVKTEIESTIPFTIEPKN